MYIIRQLLRSFVTVDYAGEGKLDCLQLAASQRVVELFTRATPPLNRARANSFPIISAKDVANSTSSKSATRSRLVDPKQMLYLPW